MDSFEILGSRRLKGTIKISGSKNAALPCLFATLLTDEPCTLEQVPNLADINTAIKLLKTLGKRVVTKRSRVIITKRRKLTGQAPYDLVRRMRASALVMGPLLARRGEAKVSLPGGCAIGARPINYHLNGFERLGVQIKIRQGYIQAKANELKGSMIPLPYPSVGATENLMMAAVLSQGETVIQNAAQEPEIVDLGLMLQSMGAHIQGLGGSQITIHGRESLSGVRHSIIPDRIEAGTYMLAAAITKGDLLLEGVDLRHLISLVTCLKASGVVIRKEKSGVRVKWVRQLNPVDVQTDVYPGFPTDMQAQWIALMAMTKGRSHVKETVFENRFLHIQELQRFGADIRLSGQNAFVRGVEGLSGCMVMVSDLRAGAALVLAGLAANGKSTILRIYHLDRGYEDMEKKLRKVGALIKRVQKKQ
ncbi:UDP-N-acetylglucosamine 1-carboxyvinyltransferase [bacterium F11]|nr:UDP-N-acetylglucosamine 1-carboxyvinyltransferase [bacterium F11]